MFVSTSPVDNPVSMQVLQGEHDFCGVEPGPGLVKLACALDLEHQVSAIHVLHHEEKALLNEMKKTTYMLLNSIHKV